MTLPPRSAFRRTSNRRFAQLFDGEPAAVDVGPVNDRYFVNVSAGGFIAEVSDAVNPQLKTIAGKFAYLLGGAQIVLNYEPVQATVRISRRQRDPDAPHLRRVQLAAGRRRPPDRAARRSSTTDCWMSV